MLDIVVISVNFDVRSTGIASASLNRNGSVLIDFSNAWLQPFGHLTLKNSRGWKIGDLKTQRRRCSPRVPLSSPSLSMSRFENRTVFALFGQRILDLGSSRSSNHGCRERQTVQYHTPLEPGRTHTSGAGLPNGSAGVGRKCRQKAA